MEILPHEIIFEITDECDFLSNIELNLTELIIE